MRSTRVLLFAAGLMFASCHNQRSPGDAPVSLCAKAPKESAAIGRFFDGRPGAFVLFTPSTGNVLCYNAERARTRELPASTFKIPNTLIALETGVAGDADFALTWDRARVPREDWWPASWASDHTLRTALSNSVVWYYRELARRIGPERMQQYVDRFSYGNRDISGGIDAFWLSGGLRISPEEQVAFLQRFYSGELGLSPRTTRIAKEILTLEDTPAFRLSGKTGWARFGDPTVSQLGWFVGYIERGGDVSFFALNMDITDPKDGPLRLAITKAILRDAGLLP